MLKNRQGGWLSGTLTREPKERACIGAICVSRLVSLAVLRK